MEVIPVGNAPDSRFIDVVDSCNRLECGEGMKLHVEHNVSLLALVKTRTARRMTRVVVAAASFTIANDEIDC